MTDHIERFTEKGLLLKSGTKLSADLIVTATGLDLSMSAADKRYFLDLAQCEILS